MIVITGAAGFIGSCIAKELTYQGKKELLLVDHNTSKDNPYLEKVAFSQMLDADMFIKNLEAGKIKDIEAIIHMGACSSTTNSDREYMMNNNFEYTKRIFDWCAKNNTRLIYASSAATYGDGNNGYSDDESKIKQNRPLNVYGESKQVMDEYALLAKVKPVQWVGLKFFNVYGPNEYHKGEMASVIFHAFNQIQKDGKVRLFKSYKKGFLDGEQKRDFIYVKDAVAIVLFFLSNPKISGIFNAGTGNARSFNDLATSIFAALKQKTNIEYIEMPEKLKDKYQYFTQAEMNKLTRVGYKGKFHTLEEGVTDYVLNYLAKEFRVY